MGITKKYLNDLTYQVIGCAIEVHKLLGPGLLESVYERCFLRELDIRGIGNKSQIWVALEYKGICLDVELRLDVLVEDLIYVVQKSNRVCLKYSSIPDPILHHQF